MRDVGAQLKAELMDVFGQRKLLRRPLPGLAHFFVFWGFIILIFTIIEAYGDLFSATFAIPLIGHARALGFLEDLFAVGVLFALVDLHHHPDHAESEAPGAQEPLLRVPHLGGVGHSGLIFGVIATLLLYRGAQVNTGHFPYGKSWWPFASRGDRGRLLGRRARPPTCTSRRPSSSSSSS